ncbi:phosphoribosyl-AMP cyclohydrolase [Archaeoglobales archaeon]|nr:MAG: phosphoribosyl-AMP cyclohydrolase [Archaeoglobales archaeon ex4484_92]RLI83538.1 MAG: phosphoribosyl-AMP cyclohydrolase [Archaeoglobales archaeon]HDN74346.1 phosphoribosyl-AMP cyclohydrolase [Archaeoglobus sp.]
MDLQLIRFNDKGLVPVVAQDVETKEVLMLAYANEEAVTKTIETGFAHYWSRSRKKLWKKGESSGNVQEVVEVRIDCDGDALLYLVRQRGVACHTGNYSCFYRRLK